MSLNLFELRRESFHILVGILVILGVLYLPYAEFVGFVILILGGFLSFLSTRFNILGISNGLCTFERECNKNFPGKGVIFFFIGSLLVLELFPKDIAISSILILTFADPVSHFIGANFGKVPGINKKKYIEGSLFGILIGTGFASFFVSLPLAFLGAFVAMFLEAIEIAMAGKTIDDNLIIPITAGTVMYLLRLRFGV